MGQYGDYYLLVGKNKEKNTDPLVFFSKTHEFGEKLYLYALRDDYSEYGYETYYAWISVSGNLIEFPDNVAFPGHLEVISVHDYDMKVEYPAPVLMRVK